MQTNSEKSFNIKTHFLFKEDTQLSEQFLKEGEENNLDFDFLLANLNVKLEEMYEDRVEYTDHEAYTLYEIESADPDSGEAVYFDLAVNGISYDDSYIHMSFEEYAQQVQLRILDSVEGHFDEYCFGMTAEGMYEASRKFSRLANLIADK